MTGNGPERVDLAVVGSGAADLFAAIHAGAAAAEAEIGRAHV